MSKSKLLLVAGAISLSIIIGVAHIAHAETHITEGYLYDSETWNASGSPYILEDTVTIPRDRSLTVEPGTTIIGSPAIDGYSAIYVQGSLVMQGEQNNRISVSGYGDISNRSGGIILTDTDISLREGLSVFGGLTVISSSTISSSTNYGLYTGNGKIDVTRSRITGNRYGVFVKKPDPPVYIMIGEDPMSGTGGEGNALDDTDPHVPQVSITDSSIVNNTVAGIYNEQDEPVSAVNNWWGSKDGPIAVGTSSFSSTLTSLDVVSGANKVVGPVEYVPWLLKDPDLATDDAVCCSSVLFLPGLEASRLYNSKYLPLGYGTSTSRLWEPLSFGDVRSLYLNADGSSQDGSVYSGGVMDIALNIKGIYYKLVRYLDGLSADGTINEWKPFAYDWREPIGQVVTGDEKKATTTESLIGAVNDLALRSKTGKVTIVAHSNGGLVAKYLVKYLADHGRADIIDKVISVAVPYLGTPEAILSLLHGTDQSIAAGLILKEYVARGLGANMASAYSLLPSLQYFSKVIGPTIAFASTTVTGVNNGAYPLTITSFAGQSDYINDAKNGRVVASTTGSTTVDTSLAIKGNSLLMNAAKALHDMLDPFMWPENIVKLAIVGWNRDTASGISYSERTKCLKSYVGLRCSPRPSHEKILTELGDGTVVVPSAIYNSGTVAAVDLKAASAEDRVVIDHSNILESSTTLTLLDKMLKSPANPSKSEASSSDLSSSLAGVPGVTVGEPSGHAEPARLVISTHSPVELHVYDDLGNHTGPVPLPPALVGSDIYDSFEAAIPGSDYSETDEGDSYVYVPDDGRKYAVSIQGTGVGEFTFDVERTQGARIIDSIEYALVPVTPLTVASTTVQSGSGAANGDSAGPNDTVGGRTLASSTSPLVVDEDGDGGIDITITPNKPFDLITYLEMYKKTVKTIAGTLPRGKTLINRIDKLETLIKAGKMKKAHDLSARLDKRMDHIKWKKLTDANKQQTLDMFDVFIQQFE